MSSAFTEAPLRPTPACFAQPSIRTAGGVESARDYGRRRAQTSPAFLQASPVRSCGPASPRKFAVRVVGQPQRIRYSRCDNSPFPFASGDAT